MPIPLELARHGECWANIENILAGAAESPLTDNGRSQAEALRQRLIQHLGEQCIVLVVETSLSRSRDTAATVRGGFPNALPPLVMDAFIEASTGDLTGQPMTELAMVLQNRQPVPGMESPDNLYARTQAGLANLYVAAQAFEAEAVVLVTHNGPSRAALCIADSLPAEAVFANPGLDNAEHVSLVLAQGGRLKRPEASDAAGN